MFNCHETISKLNGLSIDIPIYKKNIYTLYLECSADMEKKQVEIIR